MLEMTTEFAMNDSPIPSIPTYLIAVIALLLAIEYIGRYCKSSPKNYAFLGKGLTRLYFFACNVILLVPNFSLATRHNLFRYYLFVLLLFDLYYIVIEHWGQKTGSERRNDWLGLCKFFKKGKQ
jgi:hypothetical protein